MKNKKGGIPDGIFLVVSIFVVAIIFLFVYVITSKSNDFIQDSSIVSADGKAMADSLATRYPSLFDGVFAFVVAGLALAAIVGAFFIRSHPALFWIVVPILAFIVFMGAMFANIYTEISLNDQVTSYANDFPITKFIFDNFVIFITGFLAVLAIALFGKGVDAGR